MARPLMAPPETKPKRRAVRIMARSLALQVLLLLAGELYLRSLVPACDITPFRLSGVDGLSSELRPDFTTLYNGVRVSINSIGCRGPELAPREDDAIRVAVVGDSFAFGSAIELEHTIARRLEAALEELGRPAQAVNFGVPGYGAVEAAAVVEEKALRVDPDVVLYVFYANDTQKQPEYTTIPQDGVIDPMHEFVARSALLEWMSVRVRQLASGLGRPLGKRTPDFSRSVYEHAGGARVRRSITRMRDACEAAGVRFLIAGYPHLTHTDVNPFRPIDELAAADAEALGVPFLDLLEAFGGERDLTRYWASVFDHHPNGEANTLVARFLAPHVAGTIPR